MRLYYSTTSPYARIARVALAEKGFGEVDGALTDPWRDEPGLLAANPSARVPALVLDSGLPLSESLLIVLWLETRHPVPSLLGPTPDRAISKAGVAMGAIDAAAALIIGRRLDPRIDESPLGKRRQRAIANAFERLEADPPRLADGVADLAVIAAVVLVDYIRFRFAEAAWLPAVPGLDALAAQARERPSFAHTVPRDMPAAT